MLDQNENVSSEENQENVNSTETSTNQSETLDSNSIDETPNTTAKEINNKINETVIITEESNENSANSIAEDNKENIISENVEYTVSEVLNPVNEAVIVASESTEQIDTDNAIAAIEDKVAEESEEVGENEEEHTTDYTTIDQEALVKELRDLVSKENTPTTKSAINQIKDTFNARFLQELSEKKEKFIEEGGNSIDFHFESPLKKELNSLVKQYKDRQQKLYNDKQKQLEQNLSLREGLIEELKKLITEGDGSQMYKNFQAIQDRWKSIGPVPRTKYNNTWRNYHFHVERFYDLLHLSNDLRDLDFKHNLEKKLALIDKASLLIQEKDVNKAFKELQQIHKVWKEDIGPVSRESRENVWLKFSEITKQIHDKRQAYYEDLKSQYEINITKKFSIIERIKAIDTSNNKNHNDWQNSIKVLEAMRTEFFNAGNVPRSRNEEIWQAFKEATKVFNQGKNDYYKQFKKAQNDNMELKKALIEKAESLKESEDWEETTEVMKHIQQQWKQIGHVPKKVSDKMWKQFKDACNYFFDRLHKKQDEGKAIEREVLNNKKVLLEEVRNYIGQEEPIHHDKIKEFIAQWRTLGRVPYNMRHIEGKFNKAIDKAFDKLNINRSEASMMRFKNTVDNYLEEGNTYKLNGEMSFIRKKIDETVKDIQQLENNMSFFSSASDNNPLFKNVLNNIEKHKRMLEEYKKKLKYIRNLEY